MNACLIKTVINDSYLEPITIKNRTIQNMAGVVLYLAAIPLGVSLSADGRFLS
jgi:hypothetical protein